MTPIQDDIITIFKGNLKKYRQLKGYSQRELSSRCEIDNADISRMEKGAINITLKTLQQLGEALDISYLLLLTPQDEAN